MLRNTQAQSVSGYSDNLSDQAKRRTGVYQSSFEPAMEEARNRGNLALYTKKNTEIKAGNINKAASLTTPATPPVVTQTSGTTPVVSPPPVIPSLPPVTPVVNAEPAAGESIYDMPGSKIKPGTFADRWTQGGYGNLRQRPLAQPMTLRDAFSTLQAGGYGLI